MTYGPYGSIRNARTIKAPAYAKPRKGQACIKPWKDSAARSKALGAVIQVASLEPAILESTSVQDWLNPDCDTHRGMVARRVPIWGDVQPVSDHLYEQCDFASESTGERNRFALKVQTCSGPHGETMFAASLSEAAERLIAPLQAHGLPESLGQQMQSDFEEVGMVVAKMVPEAKELDLKVEIVKDNACFRWHQDSYIARAICTYNNCGTEYIHHRHVNFWELNNCGNNDHVIRDPSQVLSVGVGDFLLIKGKQFPGRMNGLVHKSPFTRHHPDGEVMTRLCIKIDVSR